MKAGFLDGKLSTKEVILNAEEIFHQARWSTGVVYCPYCGEVHKIYTCKNGYKCGRCNHKFSDRTKTLLHGSKLATDVWIQAIYEVFTDNFISSTQLAVKLHINQKSAWLLLAKLRMGLLQDDYLLSGIIAQDEMYVGGSLSNYHYGRKLDLLRKNRYILPNERKYSKTAIFALNSALKQPVFGMNNGSQIILYATPNPIKSQYIKYVYKKHVKKGSITVADESKLYNDWKGTIETNNHHNNQYKTKGGYTSNPIENTFSWYKRGFGGITHCKYHQLYLNEFVFRYNTRDLSHTERFKEALKHTIGRTITYNDIKHQKPIFKVKKEKGMTLDDIKKLLKSGFLTRVVHNNKIYTLDMFE